VQIASNRPLSPLISLSCALKTQPHRHSPFASGPKGRRLESISLLPALTDWWSVRRVCHGCLNFGCLPSACQCDRNSAPSIRNIAYNGAGGDCGKHCRVCGTRQLAAGEPFRGEGARRCGVEELRGPPAPSAGSASTRVLDYDGLSFSPLASTDSEARQSRCCDLLC